MFAHIVDALADYDVVLEPDENTPEWWAGAPSVCRGDDGVWYLAARMREGRSVRGKRGYEIRILMSDDGRRYKQVHNVHRDDAGVPVFERPCLMRHPQSGKFRLYGCAGLKDGWTIIKFDDTDSPTEINPETLAPVLAPSQSTDPFVGTIGYKDPVVLVARGEWHMFVIGTDKTERIWHFTSGDGVEWASASEHPVLENAGWHNYFTRPASVVPMPLGYLFVYEGSHTRWHDPIYNIATGLAYSPDLKTFIDLTPDQPLLRSTTPGDNHTWRYSHWMAVDDKMWVFWEAARPNNTNELRVATFDLDTIAPQVIG